LCVNSGFIEIDKSVNRELVKHGTVDSQMGVWQNNPLYIFLAPNALHPGPFVLKRSAPQVPQ